jgi:Na+/melibiose symporter-like transporter
MGLASAKRSLINRISRNTEGSVSRFQIAAFAFPNLISGILARPALYILPTIYAKYHGLSLTQIGSILLIVRLVDTVTDPLIGYLSDRTNTVIGKRKPWMIIGFLGAMVCVHRLFVPPESVDIWFFTIWFSLLLLSWTMIEIPYVAWQTELTRDYKARNQIVAARFGTGVGGELLFAAVPLLPFFLTSEITPETLEVVGWLMIVAIPVAVLSSTVFAPLGEPDASEPASESLLRTAVALAHSKPALLFLLITMSAGLGAGIVAGSFFLLLDTYLLIGDKFSIVLIANSAVLLISIPVWVSLLKILPRNKTFAVCAGIMLTGVLALVFLQPGEGAFLPTVAISLIFNFAQAGIMLCTDTILADVADYEAWRCKEYRTGALNSLAALTKKAGIAAGGGIALVILGWFSYDATTSAHTATEVIGLKLVLGVAAPSLMLIGAVSAWFFPLTRRRHEIVKRRLDSLAERAKRIPGEQR